MAENGGSASWNKRKGYYSGRFFDDQDYFRFRFAKTFLSGVSLGDEYVEHLKQLAGEGTVIYAINQRSELNSLILYELFKRKGVPVPEYCYGMNMAFWQPLPQMLKYLWFSSFRLFGGKQKINEGKRNYVENLLCERKSIIIHLGESEYIENETAERAITILADVQKKIDFPLFIVPVLVSYGRRREKEEEDLINILFGQAEHTGALRRLITFMRYARDAFIIPAEPLNLLDYLKTSRPASEKEMIRDLRGELIDRIEKEKTAMVGPILKSREELIGMVLNDSSLHDVLNEYAKQDNRKKTAVEKEARRYLYEIAADYSDTMIAIWKKFLTWLWNDIYDGLSVDKEGLARIRNIAKKMPFVIIPCHRSHIDYLLIHYVFYIHQIPLPFIAAGLNLSFFPMGYIFRKSGAFFLRRTFRGNKVYSAVIAKYLAVLLKEGLPLEFFIEGGRSRTGKMVMPKYGLLSMIIQALQDRYCDNFAAIPVYIGYDRVIEEKSYMKELTGEDKTPENTAEILKTSKILTKRYGRVYVNVGEPIIMKDYLAAQEKPVDRMSLEERQSLYRKIGYEIVLAINRVSVVTPFALVSSVILSHDRRGMSQNELMEISMEFYEYLRTRNVKFAESFSNYEKAVMDALTRFVQSGFIEKIEAEEDEIEEVQEVVYSVKEEKRLNMEYYKNNTLHFFIPISFIATAMIKNREDVIPLSRVITAYKFIKFLLWNEFIFDLNKQDEEEIQDALNYLRDKKMVAFVERDGQRYIEIKGQGASKLKPYAGLIHNYLESFWVVMRGCSYLKKMPLSQKEWSKKIMALGERMYRKGEILRREALSQANFQNVMMYLEDTALITALRDEKNEIRYTLTENRAEMEVLRRRLFRLL